MLNLLKGRSNTPIQDSLELISLHIPKTAGTSFRNTLKKEYGRGAVLRLDIRRLNKKLLIEIEQKAIDTNAPALPSGIRVVHGHFTIANIHKHFPITQNLPMITWLRDPVARVISEYYYLSKRLKDEVGNNTNALGLIRRLERSLIEFARRKASCNKMSHFLKGYQLEDFDFVGIQEYYSEDIKDLGQFMGWKTTKEYNYNANPKDREVDPEIIAEIRELNAKDIALYEQGLALREARLGKFGGAEV